MKGENASKLLSNLFVVFSHLAIISILFVFTYFIIVSTQKVSKILVYKLQDLCTLLRAMSCAIFLVLDTVLGILLTNICRTFSAISTV